MLSENDQDLTDKWLSESLNFFRRLDFYRQFNDLTIEDLVQEVKSQRDKIWDEPFDPSSETADIELLSFDNERVWYQDAEADVGMGNEVYVDALQAWAAISRGAFNPQNIREYWESDYGPIIVEFTIKDAEYRLEPKLLLDWLDVNIVFELNRLIEDMGYQFAIHKPFSQSVFIVVLTSEEKSTLERVRGWEFVK
ncbi:MAG: hypothetical protein L0332_24480 [Chloroflexi bacterium]|nr:hypothetical protein [Chloroflexota bacterium]MCI0575572.1 hypothetical protein [Chloroflexota bacterium]MCI0648261.1 hypothetical protein [Chloroflexota bacterium]MCI0729853.1 hypothetical protein [Chloroflexota bacterium]